MSYWSLGLLSTLSPSRIGGCAVLSHLAGCTYTFATEGVSEVIRVVVIETTVCAHGQQVKLRNRASSWWGAGVVGNKLADPLPPLSPLSVLPLYNLYS